MEFTVFYALREIPCYLLRCGHHTHVHTHTMESVFLLVLILPIRFRWLYFYTHSLVTIVTIFVLKLSPTFLNLYDYSGNNSPLAFLVYGPLSSDVDWCFLIFPCRFMAFNKGICSYSLFHFCLMCFHGSVCILPTWKAHLCNPPPYYHFGSFLNYRTELRQLPDNCLFKTQSF